MNRIENKCLFPLDHVNYISECKSKNINLLITKLWSQLLYYTNILLIWWVRAICSNARYLRIRLEQHRWYVFNDFLCDHMLQVVATCCVSFTIIWFMGDTEQIPNCLWEKQTYTHVHYIVFRRNATDRNHLFFTRTKFFLAKL